ncbi:protein arginine methyltransferase NDUFAF7, mitochondrial isoform X3 [Micropterus dolomieu]|uniref:protein arginine methyltransferase NDUFAF7, mitochondrial isoform X3 n=1 Tax=Micropterus dolomieu TaxID=147949 RepID=UPI001E8DEE5F|nr:protein arginine methyltransferase NDUFAF7, mitochondrial isoform X3 [Micropterus dolomieu]
MRACFGVKTQLLISRVFIHPPAAVRWRAAQTRLFCSPPAGEEKPGPSMLRHLTSKIKATGPIPVAEYMREVLTNPVTGYYVRNNMLGPDGDFITSPEISQIFGELLGVWIISEWMGAGGPKQLQLVELGPGKGSLAADVLRVLSQLRSVLGEASVSLHLVEVSPALSRLQAQNLTGNRSQEADAEDEPVYRRGETAAGLPVSWYRRLDDVPTGFSIFLAHEFFDALPIHKFQRTQKGWREVMVDIDPEKGDQLRFVVAPSPTLASSTLVQAGERRDHVEVCAEGGVVVQQLARRIVEDGGAALIADYGHDGTKTDTFRVLLRNCSDESTRKQLIGSYDMLTNPAKMGERFHFFGLLHHSRLAKPKKPEGLKLEKKDPAPLPVAGFTELRFS